MFANCAALALSPDLEKRRCGLVGLRTLFQVAAASPNFFSLEDHFLEPLKGLVSRLCIEFYFRGGPEVCVSPLPPLSFSPTSSASFMCSLAASFSVPIRSLCFPRIRAKQTLANRWLRLDSWLRTLPRCAG
jgi:hypothetical protein